MDRAAKHVGREVKDITLIAVAKKKSVDNLLEAIRSNQTIFGENYAQELLAHYNAVEKPDLRWHFIGYLQRNKVRLILDKVSLIHSVDSLPLLQEINKRAGALNKIQDFLIEINLAGESSKTGLLPSELFPLVEAACNMPHVNLTGLMTLPPPPRHPEDSRPYFQKLRELRDRINEKKIYHSPLSELSMGMTQDFEIAIEEGATLVRIGTGLFGERK